ncbi:FadR/GntR family transcriptional regulator [Lederbergia citrea]|uniref:FadR family transcriptional regulator n=1 Tax=Lederbergia citrea TaxID=2833581 RepID=A0A942UT15_9BACI|nr:FadR/GntR family transcriptional regulator [Lederbergia citrea]MBS4206028.1 FadR family transcriptional regulator [Lederbergia citrea]MBS4224523.1 FadR family transcriptional regulator [Lederbergia citrea]
MMYPQIKSKKLYEEVAEAIHESIRSGQLKPGDRLDSVEQLAENFQVGRSAIREALSALRAMGLVEMKQGEGTYIKEFSSDQIAFPLSTAILMNKTDVANLLEVRKIIETGTVASASKNRTDENLKAMEAALEEMKTANGNKELGEKADLEFHLAIAEASQNQLLSSLLNHVSLLMQETMKETRKLWLYSKQTTTEKLYDEHKKIYEAISYGDENRARKSMLEHLENVEKVLGRYFKENEKEK